MAQPVHERNQECTVYTGGLDEQVTEGLLWELMLQAGPVVNVYIPKDRVTQAHQGYGFVEFRSEEDADYAIKIMNMIKLFSKPIRVNKASTDRKNMDVGANLYVGGLDEEVDEKLLYDTFSAFGVIVQPPKIMRDPETGNSKGFGFVNYDSFEASDRAIEAMRGQYLCGKQINVTYAYKKDGMKGERHGTYAERLLAAQNPSGAGANRPNFRFADAPTVGPPAPMPAMPVPTPAAAPTPVQAFQPQWTSGAPQGFATPGFGLPPGQFGPPPGAFQPGPPPGQFGAPPAGGFGPPPGAGAPAFRPGPPSGPPGGPPGQFPPGAPGGPPPGGFGGPPGAWGRGGPPPPGQWAPGGPPPGGFPPPGGPQWRGPPGAPGGPPPGAFPPGGFPGGAPPPGGFGRGAPPPQPQPPPAAQPPQ